MCICVADSLCYKAETNTQKNKNKNKDNVVLMEKKKETVKLFVRTCMSKRQGLGLGHLCSL